MGTPIAGGSVVQGNHKARQVPSFKACTGTRGGDVRPGGDTHLALSPTGAAALGTLGVRAWQGFLHPQPRAWLTECQRSAQRQGWQQAETFACSVQASTASREVPNIAASKCIVTQSTTGGAGGGESLTWPAPAAPRRAHRCRTCTRSIHVLLSHARHCAHSQANFCRRAGKLIRRLEAKMAGMVRHNRAG
jgi:hypothetical protein